MSGLEWGGGWRFARRAWPSGWFWAVIGESAMSAVLAVSAKCFWPTRGVRVEPAMPATIIWQAWDIWPAGLRSARSGGLNRPTPMWLVDWS